MEETKKKTLYTKLTAGFSLIAALTAIAILVIILFTDNKPNQPNQPSQNNEAKNPVNENNQAEESDLVKAVKKLPDSDALEFICIKLNGFWVFDYQFFGFIDGENKQFIQYGLYATSYGVNGEIKDAKSTGDNSFSLTIFVPAVPANEMNDAIPERTETIHVDISTFDVDGKIKVKIGMLGDGEWNTYKFGGKSLEEAYN